MGWGQWSKIDVDEKVIGLNETARVDVNSIQLALYRDTWWAIVKTVIHFHVPQKV